MAFRLGNETVTDQAEYLRLACRLMAGRCDGARTHDGVGFSRFDQAFGHQMAELPWSKWTGKQKHAVYELLKKYRKTQLEPIWHLVVAPPIPMDVKRFEKQRDAARQHGRHTGVIRYAKLDNQDWFVIDVPWSSAIARRLDEIPNRVWKPELRLNLVPYAYDAIEPLFAFAAETGIEFDSVLLGKMTQQIEVVEERLALSHAKESDFQIDHIPDGQSLRPFQRAGIEYIVKHAKGRGLVADEMGLGKTIQGLVVARTLEAKHNVVISPNSAKLNWLVEANKWWPGMPKTVLWGSPPKDALDLAKRVRTIDGHLRAFPDLFAAVASGDLNRMSLALTAYQKRWNTAVVKAQMWDESPGLEDGWTPEIRDLALERFRIAKPLIKAGMAPLFLEHFLVILNWDILHAWVDLLIFFGVDIVVGDEFHKAKNPTARRSKACEFLMQHATHRIGLSGTPVMNNPAEFGQIIRLLGYIDHFGGEKGYHREYVIGEDDLGRKKPRTEILRDLNHRARARFMVRRTKLEVMPELPPVQHSTVPIMLDPKGQAEYEAVEADIAAYFARRASERREQVDEDKRLAQASGYREGSEEFADYLAERAKDRYDAAYERAEMAKALLWWEGLKQICVKAKMQQMLEWVDDFLDNSDESLVIFATHTDVIERVSKRYDAPMIYGGTTVQQRQQAVEDFQAKKVRVIVGNIIAMGEALTLTAASNVVFFEFGWNPSQHDQPIGRCHRIGQEDSVTAWYLTGVKQGGEPTVDGEIIELIAKKREVVDAITDGRGVDGDMSVLKELNARIADLASANRGNPEGPRLERAHTPELIGAAP